LAVGSGTLAVGLPSSLAFVGARVKTKMPPPITPSPSRAAMAMTGPLLLVGAVALAMFGVSVPTWPDAEPAIAVWAKASRVPWAAAVMGRCGLTTGMPVPPGVVEGRTSPAGPVATRRSAAVVLRSGCAPMATRRSFQNWPARW